MEVSSFRWVSRCESPLRRGQLIGRARDRLRRWWVSKMRRASSVLPTAHNRSEASSTTPQLPRRRATDRIPADQLGPTGDRRRAREHVFEQLGHD
ncbi:MAG: hypothetical protein ICV70_03225 [Jiangellaceae bacterium]|nr:hypothetical protein [Jiangellaceae bacterium]